MGWFDKQIRTVKQNDQETFEDSLLRMASVVLGEKGTDDLLDDRIITKAAVDEILKYFHFKPVEIPDSVRDGDEQLEYCLRPYGIMRRMVRLDEEWYKNSFGPLLAFRKEDGMPVAMLPKPFIGYWYVDPDSGRKVSVNKKNRDSFETDALCFYRPLPTEKLGVTALVHYLQKCLAFSDYEMLIASLLLGTLVGMLTPYLTRMMTGFVLLSESTQLLIGRTVHTVPVHQRADRYADQRRVLPGHFLGDVAGIRLPDRQFHAVAGGARAADHPGFTAAERRHKPAADEELQEDHGREHQNQRPFPFDDHRRAENQAGRRGKTGFRPVGERLFQAGPPDL